MLRNARTIIKSLYNTCKRFSQIAVYTTFLTNIGLNNGNTVNTMCLVQVIMSLIYAQVRQVVHHENRQFDYVGLRVQSTV